VSFAEAHTVFADPYALTGDGPHHSFENRFLIIGRSALNRMLIVAFTYRHGTARIISARKATGSERKAYER
jgi:uncharacterized DUF497 family protein